MSLIHNNNDKEVEKKIQDLHNDKVMDSQTAIFSGSERTYNDEAFSGANLIAVFGGVAGGFGGVTVSDVGGKKK